MSITLRGGVWRCHFFTPAGKRVRRSPGTADKQQALELHDKLKAEAWRVDEIGDLPTRTFGDACLRSLDDDKIMMERKQQLSGKCSVIITCHGTWHSRKPRLKVSVFTICGIPRRAGSFRPECRYRRYRKWVAGKASRWYSGTLIWRRTI